MKWELGTNQTSYPESLCFWAPVDQGSTYCCGPVWHILLLLLLLLSSVTIITLPLVPAFPALLQWILLLKLLKYLELCYKSSCSGVSDHPCHRWEDVWHWQREERPTPRPAIWALHHRLQHLCPHADLQRAQRPQNSRREERLRRHVQQSHLLLHHTRNFDHTGKT